MNKSLLLFILLILLRCCAAAASLAADVPESAKRPTNPQDIYNWILAKQGPHGILGNQENEDFSGVYTNALAAICYTHEGDLARAHAIFSFFHSRLDIALAPPGGFPQFWDAATGEPYADSDRWIGDNAWLLIALNHYLYATRDHTFDDTRRTIAEWLISLQDADGGIFAGYNGDGLMNWKSTEGNLDCYAALIDYPAAADFNADGRIDFEDYAKLAQYWGQTETSCPIAPLPIPDGQIDYKDLAELAKYWLTDSNP